ncbi:hypothetical protein FB451DRAFT_1180293 [Mycena latifolia]|nr:hypothetical protein FB451DRAFT_1180293 [Mycena latifolia]
MFRQPTVTDIRLHNTIACLTPAIAILNELSDNCGTPFLPAISNTTVSLISAVQLTSCAKMEQNVKKSKEDCVQFMEDVYQLLCSIVTLHVKSEPRGSLPPASLEHVAKFTKTIHKIHAFVEAQQGGSKIKRFFHQGDMKTLLSSNLFKMERNFTVLGNINEMRKETDKMHREVLELIATLLDGTASDSSNSISMLPAKPKIFHGRELELKQVVKALQQESSRIAILGPGGMGKTSLAKAALYHPDTASKYEQCFFVAADSATTSMELVALLGQHIGFQPAKDLTKQVIDYFSRKGPCLLILDNLETLWDPMESRGEIEEFLSKLTDIPHLALMASPSLFMLSITMRGAERPAKVHWTHPFLAPLKPLSNLAARDTFFDIAEDFHGSQDVDEVLSLTDNMPLAVELIAHAVDFEGNCSNVLDRWKTEKTSLLSGGNDRRSNLDLSIEISLSSPRMSPGAKELLSLLSLLPDGLSDVELLQSKMSINDIMACKDKLLATSLAYYDDKRRLKSLVPIREHMQSFYPPSRDLIYQLQTHFHRLLELNQKYFGTQQGAGRLHQIESNSGNIRQLLLRGLDQGNPKLSETVDCTLSLTFLTQRTGHVYYHLHQMVIDQMATMISQDYDERFKARLITGILELGPHPSINAEDLVEQAIPHFNTFNDPFIIARFYCEVGRHYFTQQDISVASQYVHKALELSKSYGDTKGQATALLRLGVIECTIGDYPAAHLHTKASHRLFEVVGDLYYQSVALRTLVSCQTAFGNLRKGIDLARRAIKLLGLCGMSGEAYRSLMQAQAEVHLLKSEYSEAHTIHAQLGQDTSTDQDSFNHYRVFNLLNVAQLDIMMGANKQDVHHNLETIKSLLNFSRYASFYSNAAVIYCDIVLAELHLTEGRTLRARSILQTCFNSTWGLDAQVVLMCMKSFANISCWAESDFDWAARWTVVYLGYAKKLENKLALHQALQFIGDVFQAEGDSATSMALFTVALEGFTWMDVHRSRAECMLRLGDLAKGQGDVSKAIELWKLARPLFERSSQAKQVTQIDGRLGAITDDVLEEQTDSSNQLVHINVPAEDVAQEAHKSTTAGEVEVERGEKDQDKEHTSVLV